MPKHPTNMQEIRKELWRIGRTLDEVFNGETHGSDRQVGFLLLVYPYGHGEVGGACVSNDPCRSELIKTLRAQADLLEAEECAAMAQGRKPW